MLKYFLEALCGQEEPLLAFKGGKYVSVATSPSNHTEDTRSRHDSQTEKEVIPSPTVFSCKLCFLFSFLSGVFVFLPVNNNKISMTKL